MARSPQASGNAPPKRMFIGIVDVGAQPPAPVAAAALARRARMRGYFMPATSGTTMTRATLAAGSGTKVMAMDLKFTSSASGPTL